MVKIMGLKKQTSKIHAKTASLPGLRIGRITAEIQVVGMLPESHISLKSCSTHSRERSSRPLKRVALILSSPGVEIFVRWMASFNSATVKGQLSEELSSPPYVRRIGSCSQSSLK